MSLIIPGNTTINYFEQANGQATSGGTKFAFIVKVNRIALVNSTAFLVSDSGGFLAYLQAANNNLFARIRTNSSNVAVTLTTTLANATDYDVLVTIDLTAGELKYYFNGSQIGSTTNVTGQTFLSFTSKMRLGGMGVDGHDWMIKEFAHWWGTIPSFSDYTDWRAGTRSLSAFTNPPTSRYAPTGDGTTYVSSLTDTAGSNNMAHIAGDTSGSNKPVADGATPGYQGSIGLSSLKGISSTTSSVFFVSRNSTTGLATFTIGGTYTGSDTPTSVEAQVGSNSYAALSSFTASAGNWSGTLNALYGVGLNIKPQNSTGDYGSAITVAQFAVGDWYIISGQSNAAGAVTNNLPGSFVTNSLLWKVNTTTGVFTRPSPSQDYHFSHAAALITRYTGVPMCMCNVAIGGTTIDTWLAPSGTSYVTATASMTAAGAINSGNKPYVVWWQGESDYSAGTTRSTYTARLRQHLSDIRTNWGVSDLFVVPIIDHGLKQAIVNATLDAVDQDPNIYYGAYINDIIDDGLHVIDANESAIIGCRLAQQLLLVKYGGLGRAAVDGTRFTIIGG